MKKYIVSELPDRKEDIVTKRLTMNLPIEIHTQFKMLCASKRQNMTDVLTELIVDYVVQK